MKGYLYERNCYFIDCALFILTACGISNKVKKLTHNDIKTYTPQMNTVYKKATTILSWLFCGGESHSIKVNEDNIFGLIKSMLFPSLRS